MVTMIAFYGKPKIVKLDLVEIFQTFKKTDLLQ